jgi:predicted Zn-dependent protease
MKKQILGRWLHVSVLCASLLAVSACETVETTKAGVVGVDRPQRMAVSSAEIDQAAQKEYSQLIAQEAKKGNVDRNPAQVARVHAISTRLIQQVGAFRPDARSWKWEMHVLSSPEINAWCMPGGKIAVYTGILDKLKLTDDELAAVLGHEMSHALREHSRERASEQAVAGVGISIISAVAGIGDLGQKGMEYAYQGLLGLPHSRAQETEADRMGVELAARAGYDPRAAVSLWQKMGAISGQSEGIKFLSTHPSNEDRLQDLTAYSAKVMPLYQQAKK